MPSLGRAFRPEARLRARARSGDGRGAAGRVSPGPWRAKARADAVSDLEKAHNAYVAHKYDDAEARLRALLDPRAGTLKDADNIADARMYLGASLVAQGKKADAESVFEQLLRDKPDYQPDSLRVTLQATDALIDVRSRMREELARDRSRPRGSGRRRSRRRRPTPSAGEGRAARLADARRSSPSEETVIQVNSRWLALVPFGVRPVPERADSPRLDLPCERVAPGCRERGQPAREDLQRRPDERRDRQQQRHDDAQGTTTLGAEDAYIATDIFTAGFALVALAGIIHAEATFVPERVDRPVAPAAAGVLVLSLAPLLAAARRPQAR